MISQSSAVSTAVFRNMKSVKTNQYIAIAIQMQVYPFPFFGQNLHFIGYSIHAAFFPSSTFYFILNLFNLIILNNSILKCGKHFH